MMKRRDRQLCTRGENAFESIATTPAHPHPSQRVAQDSSGVVHAHHDRLIPLLLHGGRERVLILRAPGRVELRTRSQEWRRSICHRRGVPSDKSFIQHHRRTRRVMLQGELTMCSFDLRSCGVMIDPQNLIEVHHHCQNATSTRNFNTRALAPADKPADGLEAAHSAVGCCPSDQSAVKKRALLFVRSSRSRRISRNGPSSFAFPINERRRADQEKAMCRR